MHWGRGMLAGALVVTLALASPPIGAMQDQSLPSGPPAPSPPAPAPANTEWYGTPILVSDLASALLWSLAAGASTSEGGPVAPLALMASLPYVFTSPVVHAVHGHGWRAVGSVVLRLALPTAGVVVGAFVGAETCTTPPLPADWPSIEYTYGCSWDGAITGALVGVVITGLGAMVIDDAVLAWGPPDEPAPAQASLRPPALQWLPTLGVAHDSGNNAVPTLGVAGSF